MFKKIFIVSLLSVFVFGGIVNAQTEELPNPGITPDSPFYFLDMWGEKIGMFFAFGNEAKGKKAFAYAEERLAEAKVMAEENEDELVEKTLDAYGELISEAAAKLAEAVKAGNVDEALAELIEKATGIHQQVLAEVYEKVPYEAKDAIQNAMEKGNKGAEEALDNVSSSGKKEEVKEKVQEKRQEVEQKVEEMRSRDNQVPEIPTFNGVEAPVNPQELPQSVPSQTVPAR